MQTFKLKKMKRVHAIHFAPDSKRLFAVGGAEMRMIDAGVWLDLATGENTTRYDQLADTYAVDHWLKRFLLVGANQWPGGLGRLQWTTLSGPAKWAKRDDPGGHVTGAAFDPTGKWLAVGAARRRGGNVSFAVHMYPVGTRKPAWKFPAEDAGQLLAFNADGTRLAFTGGADWEPQAEVYDLDTRERVFRYTPPGNTSRAVLFLPDNRLVVANNRVVYVLPAEGGEPHLTLSGHPKQVNAVALTPDGRRLLSASHDGLIRVWDAVTGEPGPSFDWKIGSVMAIAFAPDGLTCAAAGLGGKVVVWDVDG